MTPEEHAAKAMNQWKGSSNLPYKEWQMLNRLIALEVAEYALERISEMRVRHEEEVNIHRTKLDIDA